uniref:Protein SDA1 n=1 Tax=Aplanochytrium stocchinoi TaxID=215587 RepID=A0A7S3LJ65_9STRA
MEKQEISKTGENGKNLEAIQKKRAQVRNHSKRTRARKRKEEKIDKALKKAQRVKNGSAEAKRIAAPRFPAIELINDPQGFAERLFKRLKSSTESFEMRLAMMNLISRVLGFHKLLLLPFFSFLQRYLQPHQRSVTSVLAFLIQASHDLVPVEEVEPMVKLIANNFVNDRSGSEVMAVGLNSIRELVMRIPLLTAGDGMQDLVNDLIQYRRYRRDKSVVMAARGLLNFIRETNPTILARKERGKFHNESAKPLEYGQAKVFDGVEGAELLAVYEAAKEKDDIEVGSLEKENEGDEEEQGDLERVDKVRILTDEDFRRIRKIKERQEREKLNPRARRKRKPTTSEITENALVKKLKQANEINNEPLEDEEEEEEEEEEDSVGVISDLEDDSSGEDKGRSNDGAVNPHDLEGHVKQQRRELADRLRSVYAGREGSHKLANKRLGGTNNLEKTKAKNYLMVRHSKRVREKQFASLRQQQYHLKKHIKNLEKKKKTVQRIRRRTNKAAQ